MEEEGCLQRRTQPWGGMLDQDLSGHDAAEAAIAEAGSHPVYGSVLASHPPGVITLGGAAWYATGGGSAASPWSPAEY